MNPGEVLKVGGATGASYDAFMGRYSAALAPKFIATLALKPGQRALDVGCGPGALTAALVAALGASAAPACDPRPVSSLKVRRSQPRCRRPPWPSRGHPVSRCPL